MDHRKNSELYSDPWKTFSEMTFWRRLGKFFCIFYTRNGDGLVLHSSCKPWIAVRHLS